MMEQLEKAGFKAIENKLLSALSLWRNQGGTVERAHQLVSLAYGGTDQAAYDTQYAAVGSPTPSGPSAGGAGLPIAETQNYRARPKPKEPSAADKAALVSSMKAMPRTLFDTHMVGEGKTRKAIGDVLVMGEAQRIIHRADRAAGWFMRRAGHMAAESAVMRAIVATIANPTPEMKVRDAISLKKLATILRGHGIQEIEYRE
jgi:hypothetical protein